MGSLLYWKGLSNDLKRWTKECSTCQKYKSENVAPTGLLQPRPIPVRSWSSISMDFIEGIPSSMEKIVILLVVDGLTKYGHFIALSHLLLLYQ